MKELITPESGAAMLFGQVGQELLQILYPPEECEYSVEGDIPLHIDIFEDQKYPLEIKWSAQKIFRASDIPRGWLLQLMGYMGITKSTIGWMVIVNIFSRQLTTFKITMTEDEGKEQVQRIYDSRKRILEAVKKKDSDSLLVETSECTWCSYKPGRNKKKEGMESCPKYVPVVRDTASDQLPSAS
jgi:predicted Zn-ribbon and HTH transcriptional regulator